MVAIIIQARVKSARLKRKIFKKVKNKTIIEYLIERMLLTKIPIILAVPKNTYKGILFLKKYPINIFVGNEENVLERYYKATLKYKVKTIIRVTADNPFTSVTCLKKLLKIHRKRNNDLTHIINIPYGIGCEVIKFKALELCWELAKNRYDTEHVTPYIYNHPEIFKVYSFSPRGIYRNPNIRLTIDTKEDFKRFKKIILAGKLKISEIIKFLTTKFFL